MATGSASIAVPRHVVTSRRNNTHIILWKRTRYMKRHDNAKNCGLSISCFTDLFDGLFNHVDVVTRAFFYIAFVIANSEFTAVIV
jgi:hypothetical protein